MLLGGAVDVYWAVKNPLSKLLKAEIFVKPDWTNDTNVVSVIVSDAADASVGAHRLIDAPSAIPIYLAEFMSPSMISDAGFRMKLDPPASQETKKKGLRS